MVVTTLAATMNMIALKYVAKRQLRILCNSARIHDAYLSVDCLM